MRVTVISPEQSVFEGDADSVIAPAYDGMVGILPKHAPFLTLLGEGLNDVLNPVLRRRKMEPVTLPPRGPREDEA